MKVFKERTPDENPKRYGAVLLWTAIAMATLVLTSVVTKGLLSVHGAMFFGTVIGNLAVAFAAMSYERFKIPTGDLTSRHVGVTILGAIALTIGATGLTGMLTEMILSATEGSSFGDNLRSIADQRELIYERILLLDHARYIPLVLITLAFAPGICEEFFFRGVLYEFVKGVAPEVRIAFIGFVFAAVHFDIYGFFPLLIVGMVFTWMRYVTGGWVIPAVAHITFNAFSAVVLARLATDDDPSRLALVLMTVLGGGAAWAILQLLPQRVNPD